MTQSTTDRLAALVDELEIRRLIENWALFRDTGDFDRFGELWHPEGWMVATWFQASGADFTARARQTHNRQKGMHILGGSAVITAPPRATAQTRMQILSRAMVDGVEVDVSCYGRFFDFLETVDGVWKLRHRQPVYELDQLRPVDPNAKVHLDPAKLAQFPEGYRHLAYVQSLMGFEVNPGLPGARGPAVETLTARGADWLSGVDVDLRAPLG
jgi:hypothetical protein